MTNKFEVLTRVIINYVKIPAGMSHRQKRKNRKHLVRTVGVHGTQSERDTCHRRDKRTLLDDEGNITQTAGKLLLSLDARGYENEQALINHIYAEINIDLDDDEEEDRPFPPGIVKAKIDVFVVGGWQTTLDYMAEHAAEWGE